VPSHTHLPLPLHSCPDGHAAHAAPPAPHEVLDSLVRLSHVALLQQPGHDVPPQEHEPSMHMLPDEHAAHAAPPVPHSVED
jgi:hypothetical protein